MLFVSVSGAFGNPLALSGFRETFSGIIRDPLGTGDHLAGQS
jgi:hypothetical protein